MKRAPIFLVWLDHPGPMALCPISHMQKPLLKVKKEKLQIKLGEIPEEGQEFHYSSQSGEMNLALKDLVNEKPYDVSFTVRPVGNVFEVKGQLEATLPRVCSKCGWDLDLPVKGPISEILIPKGQEERGDSQSKKGFIGANEVAVTYFSGGVFNAESMVHEILALRDPLYPDCGVSDCPNLEDVKQKMRELELAAESLLHPEKKNPFDVLKKIKLD